MSAEGAAVQRQADYTALPSTRAEALAVGAKTYFDGKPCKQGHVVPWSAKANICVQCRRERYAAYIAANPEKRVAYQEKTRPRAREAARAHRAKDPAAANARTQAWREKNKEHLREYNYRKHREDIEKSRAEGRAGYYRAKARREALLPPKPDFSPSGLPTSRNQAAKLGSLMYETGKPCAHGHMAPRYTAGGGCLECGREAAREWGRNNKASVTEKNRAYYATNKEQESTRSRAYKAQNREKISAFNSAYRLKHLARLKERDRIYNRENRDRIREWSRAFRKRNPHKNAEYHNRRRALFASADGSYTAADVVRIIKAQGGKCACCGRKRKLTVDHIIPLSKGGSNAPSNLQMLCKSCNSSKSNRDPLEFFRSQGRLL